MTSLRNVFIAFSYEYMFDKSLKNVKSTHWPAACTTQNMRTCHML